MFARKEKTHDQHNSSGKEKLDHAFQDNVVHFELLVKSVDGVANTLVLQPTATLSRARVTLMIIS